ncbi:DUF2262 domain-containing protein [Rhodopirellula halodulae]|uniref:DUF2262 domain-containing protein n=1 Tax=Rhodopirellula halodulae TaxID=2894198 RepID=UPI001E3C8E03|nr:DUF2262 domain-containing protein [Rhodopirellula sp. JC737]MCC9656287.1 DUF2262 domain-containing protein [Rhodopirellula sp. JC737]
MSESYEPPTGEELSTVDVADCEYTSGLIEIDGLISESGQGGWPGEGRYTVHSFTMAAWRRTGQSVRNETLLLLRPVPETASYFGDFQAGTLHRFEVLLSVDQTRAIVSKIVEENIKDDELEAIAIELARPVVLQTERFGELTLNRSIHWFEGVANWNSQEVEISLETDEDLDITNQLETAETLFANAAEWQEKINAFAVAEKLELANDWQEKGQKLDADEFLQRMSLNSITIKPDGEFEFWHDDGDIFFGHSIQISGSLTQGLTDSDIPG